MKILFTFLSAIFMLLTTTTANAQANVLNPNDPDVLFTSGNQPAPPAWNDYKITKWGHVNTMWWGSYGKGYRSYIYKGMAFRIKFPKTYQHNVADGKKYPLLVFLHGYGEMGTIYDNEQQLANGGMQHADSINSGSYDGFVFFSAKYKSNIAGLLSLHS